MAGVLGVFNHFYPIMGDGEPIGEFPHDPEEPRAPRRLVATLPGGQEGSAW
jgi:hypothetical protein